jgi:Cft2 family RNA processing exonuclease
MEWVLKTSICLRYRQTDRPKPWTLQDIKVVFSSIEKCTMQKKITRHIKLAIHAWSTKCG